MNSGSLASTGIQNTVGGEFRTHIPQTVNYKDVVCQVYSLGDVRLKSAIVEVELEESTNYLFINHSALNNRVQVSYSIGGMGISSADNYILSDVTVESFSSTLAIPIPTMANRRIRILLTDTANLNSNYSDRVRILYGYLPDTQNI